MEINERPAKNEAFRGDIEGASNQVPTEWISDPVGMDESFFVLEFGNVNPLHVRHNRSGEKSSDKKDSSHFD